MAHDSNLHKLLNFYVQIIVTLWKSHILTLQQHWLTFLPFGHALSPSMINYIATEEIFKLLDYMLGTANTKSLKCFLYIWFQAWMDLTYSQIFLADKASILTQVAQRNCTFLLQILKYSFYTDSFPNLTCVCKVYILGMVKNLEISIFLLQHGGFCFIWTLSALSMEKYIEKKI